MTVETITHQQVIDLVKTLPSERLQSIYDFTLFLKQQPSTLTSETDLFGESDEEIQADEERWQSKFALSRDKLREMAREARAEYYAGRVQPLRFDRDGRIIR